MLLESSFQVLLLCLPLSDHPFCVKHILLLDHPSACSGRALGAGACSLRTIKYYLIPWVWGFFFLSSEGVFYSHSCCTGDDKNPPGH